MESAPSLNRVNFVSEVKIPILMVSKYILVMQGRLGGWGRIDRIRKKIFEVVNFGSNYLVI